MSAKRFTIAGAVMAMMLVIPALALAGERPPEGTQYAKTGSTTFATTHADSDGNKKAEKVDLANGIYECGNNVPVAIDNLAINKKGKYKFDGKTKNLAGQKVDLRIRGTFKSATKLVQKTTIYKGKCEETVKVVMKRQ